MVTVLKTRSMGSMRILLLVTVLAGMATPIFGQALPLLDPLTLTKFSDPLFSMPVAQPSGTMNGSPLYDINIGQFQWSFSSQIPAATIWGYGYADASGVTHYSFPGPTFSVNTNETVNVRYTNLLADPVSGAPLSNPLPVDTTLMEGMIAGLPTNRTVVHLHGGHNPGIYDGNPFQDFSSTPAPGGTSFWMSPSGIPSPATNTVTYTYENKQQSALLWYHDHSMGTTHLNPYLGMAGGYKINDALEASLNLPPRMVPLVFQDKMFQADGQLFYPRGPGDLVTPGGATPLAGLPANFPSAASIIPEFFGNVNTVNGTVWPKMEVEPTLYRFPLLNASNSRTYMLQAQKPDGTFINWNIIGSDGGLLPAPVNAQALTIMPGERYDTVLDFTGLPAGTVVTMHNVGPDGPFMRDPAMVPADPATTGQVMQFWVRAPNLYGAPAGTVPSALNPITRLDPAAAAGTRNITLNESADQYGRLMLLLNQTPFAAPVTEIVNLNDTEVWNFINVTPDVHPMHLHLVEFQVIGRQALLPDPLNPGSFLPQVDPGAPLLPPPPEEMGWKDTLQTWPGYQTSIIAQFTDYTGDYVYHCHILDHEDFDMMRPFVVVPEPGTLCLVTLGGAILLIRRRLKHRI